MGTQIEWTPGVRDKWLTWRIEVEMTDSQLAALDDVARVIAERWPDEDESTFDQRLEGALSVIVGQENQLDKLARRVHIAKMEHQEAKNILQGAMVASADLGPSEVARRAKVSRETARVALGLSKWSKGKTVTT